VPTRLLAALFISAACAAGAEPKTVHFLSEDRQTNLTGYLFERPAPVPVLTRPS
jgi:hypothetical protein